MAKVCSRSHRSFLSIAASVYGGSSTFAMIDTTSMQQRGIKKVENVRYSVYESWMCFKSMDSTWSWTKLTKMLPPKLQNQQSTNHSNRPVLKEWFRYAANGLQKLHNLQQSGGEALVVLALVWSCRPQPSKFDFLTQGRPTTQHRSPQLDRAWRLDNARALKSWKQTRITVVVVSEG